MTEVVEQAAHLARAGKIAEAASMLAPIVEQQPDNFPAVNTLAALRAQQGLMEEAEGLFARCAALRPDVAEVHYNRGAVLQRAGRRDEAMGAFDAALAIRPDYPDANGNRAVLLAETGRYEDALAGFAAAAAARPSPEIWTNHAGALLKLGRHRESLASYNRALALKPDHGQARRGRASVYFQLRQFAEALSDIASILARDPADAPAWQLRGDICTQTGRREQAVESYTRAIEGRPDAIDALYNRAHNLSGLSRYDEAARDYAAVVALDPDYPYALGHLIFAKYCCCDWHGLDELRGRLLVQFHGGTLKIQPFHALVLLPSESAVLEVTRSFATEQFPPTEFPVAHQIPLSGRIRIAYLSANFHNHAVARQLAGVFEHHDRSRFDVVAFSLGADDGGAMRRRLTAAFSEFIDARTWDDDRIAGEIRRRNIDILVDLMGFTENGRPGVAARRPAPVQVSFTGYPGTTGSGAADYLIADEIVIPPGREGYYAERILRLPNCYLPQDDARVIADGSFAREAAGLPGDGVVFCCFNHAYKIGPEIFGVWMRLLRNVPGSVLWLNSINPQARSNLLEAVRQHDIAPESIVFAGFVPADSDHLARLRLASLFLDTPGYNAHATASDALWAGVPVVTITGDRFCGRVGASLLHSLGMDELITSDLSEYEQLALALARDPERLCAIRQKLAKNIRTYPLFDTARFTRDLEQLYERIAARPEKELNDAIHA